MAEMLKCRYAEVLFRRGACQHFSLSACQQVVRMAEMLKC